MFALASYCIKALCDFIWTENTEYTWDDFETVIACFQAPSRAAEQKQSGQPHKQRALYTPSPKHP